LKKWKGVDILINAAEYLTAEYRVLLVGGREEQHKSLHDRIDNIPDNVTLVGHVSTEVVPNYLVASDILVLPNTAEDTISSQYTSPLKMFEYMAVGQPIVSSDVVSVREVLTDRMAEFVAPDDPQALADGIVFIRNNPEYAERLAEQAATAAKQYSWEKRAKEINEVFKM
jgi:glycosyltransferase involved in cell wall biosynthesis